MTTRHLIAPLTVAILLIAGTEAMAQGAFPAPLPGQQAAGQVNDPAFPPVNGSTGATIGAPSGGFPVNGAPPFGGGGMAPAGPSQAGGPSEDCMKGFLPLRAEAEKRGKLIKAASERHASPDEACKLIASFSKAEMNMIKYVETHSAKCGIPGQVAEQLKNGHKNTEGMQTKVCAVAQQVQQRGPAGPSLSEVLGSSAALPEATASKRGGSTFDTLNGNVLAR